jgi:hypothetical protein
VVESTNMTQILLYNFKFPITTDMNTDLKLDTLKFVYYFCYLHYDLLLVSLLRLHAICVFFPYY